MADPVIRIPEFTSKQVMIDVDVGGGYLPTVTCSGPGNMAYDTVNIGSAKVDGEQAITFQFCSEAGGWLGRPLNVFEWLNDKTKAWDSCSNLEVVLLASGKVYAQRVASGAQYSILSEDSEGANTRTKKIIETTLWCAGFQSMGDMSKLYSKGLPLPEWDQLASNVEHTEDETPVPAVPVPRTPTETRFIDVLGAEPTMGYGGH